MANDGRYEDLDAALAAAIEDGPLLERLRDELASKRESLSKRSDRALELEELVEQARVDVDRLEGTSLAGLFQDLFGDRAAKLAERRRGHAEAKGLLEAQQSAGERLEHEIESLVAEIRRLGDPKERYRLLFEEKSSLVRSGGDEAAALFIRLSEDARRLGSEIGKLTAAIGAGEIAGYDVESLIDAIRETVPGAELMCTFGRGAARDRDDEKRAALWRFGSTQLEIDAFLRELAAGDGVHEFAGSGHIRRTEKGFALAERISDLVTDDMRLSGEIGDIDAKIACLEILRVEIRAIVHGLKETRETRRQMIREIEPEIERLVLGAKVRGSQLPAN
jgi:hypothetical protein